jgi:hypothetical protein
MSSAMDKPWISLANIGPTAYALLTDCGIDPGKRHDEVDNRANVTEEHR